uniref:hypothetical protein n=1 Tax=Acinetobacter gerneri TaxID=202952 RepID=UPI00293BB5AB|nr:hypothetical protein [Acinetobacter gerneri]WNL65497.1 hypothetical protein GPGIFMOB_00448 [Acinetobacter gerneri]
MENIQNEEDILQDATRAVFNCGTSFSEAKVVSLTDEFNPQPTLQTQRTNLKYIYDNKLPNEIGRQLAQEPEYQEETRSLLVGHFKEMALEDLIEAEITKTATNKQIQNWTKTMNLKTIWIMNTHHAHQSLDLGKPNH